MILQAIHIMAALIVLAEALNKIERADLFDGRTDLMVRVHGFGFLLAPWRWRRARAVTVLKVIGWALLSIGAGQALFGLFSAQPAPSGREVAVLAGFAFLIVRSRIKEG
jgi:hypothetical protein